MLPQQPAYPHASRLWGGLRRSAVAGSAASVLSAGVLAGLTRRREGDAAAGLNAVSHWVHGNPALCAHGADGRHTAVGALIHHLSSLFWAAGFEAALAAWRRRTGRACRPRDVLTAAAATTAVAAFTDLRAVPHRLTPGFQHHLSGKGLLAVYAAFGVGLALAALWSVQRDPCEGVRRRWLTR